MASISSCHMLFFLHFARYDGWTVDSYVDDEASDFDTQDYHLMTSGSRIWERSAVGFRVNYAEEIIINSELAEAIPDEPDLGGHGWPAWAGPAIWAFFAAL